MIVDVNKKWIDLYKKYYEETKIETYNIEMKDYKGLLDTIKRKEKLIQKIEAANVNNSLIKQGVEREVLLKIQKLEHTNLEQANKVFIGMKKAKKQKEKRIAYINEYIK